MSLSSIIRLPEVRERLDLVLPSVERLSDVPIRAEPLTERHALTGTAFDYALRFELHRRNPHALATRWVAEDAVARIPEAAELAGLSKKEGQALRLRAASLCKEARAFVASYVSKPSPTSVETQTLAVHAIHLAKLDNVFRALRLDSDGIETADPNDVQDILNLLAIVPYDQLSHPKAMRLNPTFGRLSIAAGGADADLLTGNRLVDFKTTKHLAIRKDILRQLVGYLLLARGLRDEQRSFPAIRHLAIYFSRHGCLWTIPAGTITKHRRFRRLERWFLRNAFELGDEREYSAFFVDLWHPGRRRTIHVGGNREHYWPDAGWRGFRIEVPERQFEKYYRYFEKYRRYAKRNRSLFLCRHSVHHFALGAKLYASIGENRKAAVRLVKLRRAKRQLRYWEAKAKQ